VGGEAIRVQVLERGIHSNANLRFIRGKTRITHGMKRKLRSEAVHIGFIRVYGKTSMTYCRPECRDQKRRNFWGGSQPSGWHGKKRAKFFGKKEEQWDTYGWGLAYKCTKDKRTLGSDTFYWHLKKHLKKGGRKPTTH